MIALDGLVSKPGNCQLILLVLLVSNSSSLGVPSLLVLACKVFGMETQRCVACRYDTLSSSFRSQTSAQQIMQEKAKPT